MLILNIVVLLFLVIFCFWQGSLLWASVFHVPTVYANDRAILDAFELANLKKGELIADLGCGNAKSLIMAAKRYGARGIGVENSLYCYLRSRLNVLLAGETKNIRIVLGDFKRIESELKKCDVVYLYLINSVLKKIEPWYFAHLGKKARTVVLCFWFDKHAPCAEKKTVNLGRETKVWLYLG